MLLSYLSPRQLARPPLASLLLFARFLVRLQPNHLPKTPEWSRFFGGGQIVPPLVLHCFFTLFNVLTYSPTPLSPPPPLRPLLLLPPQKTSESLSSLPLSRLNLRGKQRGKRETEAARPQLFCPLGGSFCCQACRRGSAPPPPPPQPPPLPTTEERCSLFRPLRCKPEATARRCRGRMCNSCSSVRELVESFKLSVYKEKKEREKNPSRAQKQKRSAVCRGAPPPSPSVECCSPRKAADAGFKGPLRNN